MDGNNTTRYSAVQHGTTLLIVSPRIDPAVGSLSKKLSSTDGLRQADHDTDRDDDDDNRLMIMSAK